jgi:hypothetical protein
MLSNLSKDDDETKLRETGKIYPKRLTFRRFETLRHKDLQEYGHSASRTGPV